MVDAETGLWAVLTPILLIDVLNPVLLAAVIYALGTRRPYASSLSILLGHTLTYFAAGVGLALGLEELEQRLRNPEPIDFWIELALGLILLGVGVAMARGSSAQPDFGAADRMGPASGFLTGAIVNLIGIPFAVPYFAALSQILKADLTAAGALGVLVAYNLLYPAPFAAVVAARRIGGRRAEESLRRLSARVDRLGAVLAPLLLLALGAAFVADAAWFFLSGEPLYPV